MLGRAASFIAATAFVVTLGIATDRSTLGTAPSQPKSAEGGTQRVDVHGSAAVTVGTLPNGGTHLGDYNRISVEVDVTIDPRPETRP